MTEAELHRGVVAYLRLSVSDDAVWWHTPSEGIRGGRQGQLDGAKRLSLGCRSGVADLTFVLPGGGAGFIELKMKGRYLSPAQREFKDEVEDLGAVFETCRSLDEVERTLRQWGLQLRGRLT